MTTREEFEAWAAMHYGEVERWDEVYLDHEVRAAWAGWRASREVALEEAAKECDLMQASYQRAAYITKSEDSFREWGDKADGAEQCAMGIRALKD